MLLMPFLFDAIFLLPIFFTRLEIILHVLLYENNDVAMTRKGQIRYRGFPNVPSLLASRMLFAITTMNNRIQGNRNKRP